MEQSITSRDTSINQIPGLHKKIPAGTSENNLDYGGGRYDKATDYLATKGITSRVYDPFNRTPDHNRETLEWAARTPLDTITVANVLNVIKEDTIIDQILEHLADLAEPYTVVWFTCYEGDRSGQGRETTKGYQRNQRTRDYLGQIRDHFEHVTIHNNIIKAWRTAQ
jgi:hypothetical protein